MMDRFKNAKWIWIDFHDEIDSYGEFYTPFIWRGGKTACRISCDGDYTLYINGAYAASWQYADYEHYKVYDEVDITKHLQPGENHLAVLVWHYGENSQRYRKASAGVLFEVIQDDAVLAVSGCDTLCRKSRTFISGRAKKITAQMGFGFCYTAPEEDGWKTGEAKDLHRAVLVAKNCRMVLRPTMCHSVLPALNGTCLQADGDHYLLDLGAETVGVPVLQFISPRRQTLTVHWGEDLQNGHVRRVIGERNFSFTYVASQGGNDFTNYMLRMGCRYLEIEAEEPITIACIGVCPVVYPVKEKPFTLPDSLDQRIYDVCVRTLELCMMDHYADTPWREQCLYAFDARNQMLCGYYAFEGGNAAYARANLKLIGEDQRGDGLLSITYPCGVDLTIPSFSLHYFRAIREYVEHTGDVSLAREVFSKLQSVLDVFLQQRTDGLLGKLSGTNHWNFYDWSPHLEGRIFEDEEPTPDLVLNCLFLLACRDYMAIAAQIGERADLQGVIDDTAESIRRTFFQSAAGLFSHTEGGADYTVLGNALAVLAGLADDGEARRICDAFETDEMSDCSLSMKVFPYDAMLETDRDRYMPYILTEIRRTYGEMLSQGATSVWEAAEGAAAFDNAGSLCHGWSAVPVYYYHLLHSDDRGSMGRELRVFIGGASRASGE